MNTARKKAAVLFALLLLFSVPLKGIAFQTGITLPVFLTFYRMPLWIGPEMVKMPAEMLSDEKMLREELDENTIRFEQEIQGLRISGTATRERETILTMDAWVTPGKFPGTTLCLAYGIAGMASADFLRLQARNLDGAFTYRGYRVTSEMLTEDPVYIMKISLEWVGD